MSVKTTKKATAATPPAAPRAEYRFDYQRSKPNRFAPEMQDTVAVVLNRGVAAVTRRYSSSIVVEKGDRLPGPSYEVVVSWSAADRAFVAEVPELPGCAADGASHAEAIANVEIVMREWIETAIDLGREIPVPKAG